jgi:hypothetical protein
VKTILKWERGCEEGTWIQLKKDSVQCRALVAAMGSTELFVSLFIDALKLTKFHESASELY